MGTVVSVSAAMSASVSASVSVCASVSMHVSVRVTTWMLCDAIRNSLSKSQNIKNTDTDIIISISIISGGVPARGGQGEYPF